MMKIPQKSKRISAGLAVLLLIILPACNFPMPTELPGSVLVTLQPISPEATAELAEEMLETAASAPSMTEIVARTLEAVLTALSPTVTAESTMPSEEGTPGAAPPGSKAVSATPVMTDAMGLVEIKTFESTQPYELQFGSPAYVENFAHPETGCKWMGAAGQVFDRNGIAVSGFIVKIGGDIAGETISESSLAGTVPTYGPGGYEIDLAEKPIASNDTVWIQVFNLQGQAVSPSYYFETDDACSENLILINFAEIAGKPSPGEIIFPLLHKSSANP